MNYTKLIFLLIAVITCNFYAPAANAMEPEKVQAPIKLIIKKPAPPVPAKVGREPGMQAKKPVTPISDKPAKIIQARTKKPAPPVPAKVGREPGMQAKKPVTPISDKPAKIIQARTKPAPKIPESKIKKESDIVNVCIFLEKYYDGKSQEIEEFKGKLEGLRSVGAITEALIAALYQKVDVVISSAALVIAFEMFKKNFDLKFYKKKIEDYGKEIEDDKKEIEGFEKDIEVNKQYIEDYKKYIELNKKYIELNKQYIEMYNRYIEINKKDILEDFSIYKTEDSEFAIFVKKGKSLKDVGLNQSLKVIDKSKLEQEFINIKPERVNIISLESIFSVGDIIRKIIYLNGHGSFGSSIAGFRRYQPVDLVNNWLARYQSKEVMNRDPYVDFVNYLLKISCIFLFTSSCYSGGSTTLYISEKFAEEQKKEYMDLPYNFIMVFGVVSDVSSTMFRDINYNKFFQGVHDLFKVREKSDVWTSIKQFKNILINLTGKRLENTPLIRFPGVRQFFRPVDVDDKVQIITYPFLLEHEFKVIKKPEERTPEENKKLKTKIRELEEIYKKISTLKSTDYTKDSEKKLRIEEALKKLNEELKNKIGKIKIEKKPIEINNKEAILIYPSVIDNTIKIIGQKVPAMVSMFPGNAKHFIKSLDASQIQLDNLIKEMFWNLEIESKKLFFIGDITCKNFTGSNLNPENPSLDNPSKNIRLKNVLIETEFKYSDSKYKLVFLFNGNYKCLTYDMASKTIIPDVFAERPEGPNYFEENLALIKPTKNAYMEATGGIESEFTFKNALNRFFREQKKQK